MKTKQLVKVDVRHDLRYPQQKLIMPIECEYCGIILNTDKLIFGGVLPMKPTETEKRFLYYDKKGHPIISNRCLRVVDPL